MAGPSGFEIGKAYISVGLKAGGVLASLTALELAAGTAGAALGALPALAASVGTSAVIMADSIGSVADAVEAHTKAITKDRVAEIVATQGVTKEYAKYLYALEQMGPAQQKVTKQVIDMQDAWDGLRKAGNEPFMEGVSEFLEDADDLFPVLQEHMRDTGRVLGELAEDAGELFASQEFQANLDAYLDNTQTVTDGIGDTLVDLTDDAVRFGAQMDQTASGFVDFLGGVTDGVGGMFDELAKYDAEFQAIWQAWGDIFDAVLPALGSAIGQMAETIEPVLTDIAGFLQENKDDLDDWIVGLTMFGAAILGLRVATTVGRGLTGLVTQIATLGAVAGTTAGLVGLVAVGVVGVIAGAAALSTTMDELNQSIADGNSSFDDMIDRQYDMLKAQAEVADGTAIWQAYSGQIDVVSKHLEPATLNAEQLAEQQRLQAEAVGAAEAEWSKFLGTLEPAEALQARVGRAQREYNDAVAAFGAESTAAQAAQRLLAQVTNEEEAAQLAAKRATMDHTDALRAQQDQVLAMSDANLAQRQAQLDLTRAQQDLTEATKEYGAGSLEAEAAQIRFEQAQNRVITSTQRQSQVAGEGQTATEQARLASEQFTYTNLTLAATLGNQASPSVQQFARDMSDAELQAFNAAQKTSGFHYEIRQLPDGRDVYIRTDPETGEVIQYREELLKIPPVVSIRVTADGKYSISSNGIKVNNQTGEVYGPGRSGLADGGILAGYTPGRDVHEFVGPGGDVLGLSGGEAVMRPEWTRAVGAASVNALNAAARTGGVSAVRKMLRRGAAGDEDVPRLGFAAGGIYDFLPPMAKDQANDLVSTQSAHLAREIGQQMFAMGGLSGPGGWQWMMSALRGAFPGLRLISGFRPGAITATGNPSYHGKGRAVDVPPSMAVFDWIRANYGARSKELIFSPAGGRQVHNGAPHVYSGVTRANHWDHVHWAYDQGGILPPGTTVAHNNTGRNEYVHTEAQMQQLSGGSTVVFNVQLDPTKVKSMDQLLSWAEGIRQSSRQGQRRMAGGRA